MATASRTAFLIDNQSYYDALVQGLNGARRSIWILGWAFDPRTRMKPDGQEGPRDPDEIGRLLIQLAQDNPQLDVRLLIWRSTLPFSGSHDLFASRARRWFKRTSVKFRLDNTGPFGACHHQKLVIIDDEIAFCGGGDLTPNRWDTPAHLDRDPRRILPDRSRYPARHEVTMMVEGEPAHALAELFRQRWRAATGESLSNFSQTTGEPGWPDSVLAQVRKAQIGVARTQPGSQGGKGVDEIRRLALAAIQASRRLIYLENQYFTCEEVAEALAQRLSEPDGPEVILLVGARSPSWFDRVAMDTVRNERVRRLIAADRHHRFRAFQPLTARGERIIVHSKVSIFDDELARVGSANLNNRSGGLDTECELALVGESAQTCRAIADFRNGLISHFMGISRTTLTQVERVTGSLVMAIDLLNLDGRLASFATPPATILEHLVSGSHLGDPRGVSENWRVPKALNRVDRGQGPKLDL